MQSQPEQRYVVILGVQARVEQTATATTHAKTVKTRKPRRAQSVHAVPANPFEGLEIR